MTNGVDEPPVAPSPVPLAAPLLAPLAADEWGDPEYAAFGALLGLPGDQVPRAGSGHVADPLKFDIIGLLARHPKMARKFLGFNGWLLQRGELPLRLRELAILRVASARRSAFFWGEHGKIALDGGISEADIARLERGNEGFDGHDLLVLEATDELLGNGKLAAAAWQTLAAALGEHRAMEVIFVVGTYAMLASAFDTWGLQPPAGSPRFTEIAEGCV